MGPSPVRTSPTRPEASPKAASRPTKCSLQDEEAGMQHVGPATQLRSQTQVRQIGSAAQSAASVPWSPYLRRVKAGSTGLVL